MATIESVLFQNQRAAQDLYTRETPYAGEYVTVLSEYMMLPCLRFLGAGGLGSAGEWRDVSGNRMHLTYNGNPMMGYTTNGAPYWAYDGTGDYHSHVNEAHFQITGTETTVATTKRGLTFGCWVYFNGAAAAGEAILNKFLTTGNQRSYYMRRRNTGILQVYISSDGTATVNTDSTATVGATTWYFTAARFIPSTSLDLFLNDTEYSNAVGIPAAIFNSTAIFEVSGTNAGGAELLSGAVAFPFVCACALSDAQITRLYNRSRGLFGV